MYGNKENNININYCVTICLHNKKSVRSSEIIKNVWNIIAISHSCIKIIYVYSLNIDSKLIILGFYKIAKNNNNG